MKRTFRIVPFAALFLVAACASSPYDTGTGSSFTSSSARGVSTTEASAAATGSAASTGGQREPAGVMNNPK